MDVDHLKKDEDGDFSTPEKLIEEFIPYLRGNDRAAKGGRL